MCLKPGLCVCVCVCHSRAHLSLRPGLCVCHGRAHLSLRPGLCHGGVSLEIISSKCALARFRLAPL